MAEGGDDGTSPHVVADHDMMGEAVPITPGSSSVTEKKNTRGVMTRSPRKWLRGLRSRILGKGEKDRLGLAIDDGLSAPLYDDKSSSSGGGSVAHGSQREQKRWWNKKYMVVETIPGILSLNNVNMEALFREQAKTGSSIDTRVQTILSNLSEAVRAAKDMVGQEVMVFDCGFQGACESEVQAGLGMEELFSSDNFCRVTREGMGAMTVQNILNQALRILLWIESDKSKRKALVFGSNREHHAVLLSCLQVWSNADKSNNLVDKTELLDALTKYFHLFRIRLGPCSRLLGHKNFPRSWNCDSSSPASDPNGTLSPSSSTSRLFRVSSSKLTISPSRCSESTLVNAMMLGEFKDVVRGLVQRYRNNNLGLGDDKNFLEWRTIHLRKIAFTHCPRIETTKPKSGCRPYVLILSGDGSEVIYSSMVHGIQEAAYKENEPLAFEVNCKVKGDILIKVYHLPMGMAGVQILQMRVHTATLEPRESESMHYGGENLFANGEQLLVAQRHRDQLEKLTNLPQAFDDNFAMELLVGMPRKGRELAIRGPSVIPIERQKKRQGPPKSVMLPPMKSFRRLPPLQMKCSSLRCGHIDYFHGFSINPPRHDKFRCPICLTNITSRVCVQQHLDRIAEESTSDLGEDHLSCSSSPTCSDVEDDTKDCPPDANDKSVDLEEAEHGQMRTMSESQTEEKEDIALFHEVQERGVETNHQRSAQPDLTSYVMERLDNLCEMFSEFSRRELQQHLQSIAFTCGSIEAFDTALESLILETLIPQNEERMNENVQTRLGPGRVREWRHEQGKVAVDLPWGQAILNISEVVRSDEMVALAIFREEEEMANIGEGATGASASDVGPMRPGPGSRFFRFESADSVAAMGAPLGGGNDDPESTAAQRLWEQLEHDERLARELQEEEERAARMSVSSTDQTTGGSVGQARTMPSLSTPDPPPSSTSPTMSRTHSRSSNATGDHLAGSGSSRPATSDTAISNQQMQESLRSLNLSEIVNLSMVLMEARDLIQERAAQQREREAGRTVQRSRSLVRRSNGGNPENQDSPLPASVSAMYRTRLARVIQSIIEDLPTHKFDSTRNHREMEEATFRKCMVCQCEYEHDEIVRTLPCLHAYHAECIDGWLMKTRACPVCQRRIDDSDHVHVLP